MKQWMMAVLCLWAGSAMAAEDIIQTPAYKECILLATSSPEKALIKAENWLVTDPSIPAYHCRSVALYGLKRYKEAAEALVKLRKIIPPNNFTLRSFVSRQAAGAWGKANQADAATAILDAQINELSRIRGNNAQVAKLTSDLLLDRAQLNISAGKLSLAAKDLDHAISLNPVNTNALLERAKTFELLGDFPLAKADAEAVLTINPGNEKARRFLTRLEDKMPTQTP